MNTQTDMLKLANIMRISRYFKMPDPQQLQQMMSQPKPPDPMLLAAQAQMEKGSFLTRRSRSASRIWITRAWRRKRNTSTSRCRRRVRLDIQKMELGWP